jgi:tight adherence protein B
VIAVLVACLLGCVVTLAWPRAGALTRLAGDRPAFRLGGLPRLRMPVSALGRRGVLGAAAVAALAGLLLGGPVAALVGAVYAGLGTAEWVRRAGRKQVAVARAASLDGLTGLVADLRAGLPPALASQGPLVSVGPLVPAGPLDTGRSLFSAASRDRGTPLAGDRRITRLTGAVWQLAERTGAPAADLLERIETDARAADRAAASASAQAAGAQVTALLLAALPLGGIGLGYSIGADPLHILLRTPLGAACAIAALLLQCAGLLWARRLVEGPR